MVTWDFRKTMYDSISTEAFWVENTDTNLVIRLSGIVQHNVSTRPKHSENNSDRFEVSFLLSSECDRFDMILHMAVRIKGGCGGRGSASSASISTSSVFSVSCVFSGVSGSSGISSDRKIRTESRDVAKGEIEYNRTRIRWMRPMSG